MCNDSGGKNCVEIIRIRAIKGDSAKIKDQEFLIIGFRVTAVLMEIVNPDSHFAWIYSCDINVRIAPELSPAVVLLIPLRISFSEKHIRRRNPYWKTCLCITDFDNDLLPLIPIHRCRLLSKRNSAVLRPCETEHGQHQYGLTDSSTVPLHHRPTLNAVMAGRRSGRTRMALLPARSWRLARIAACQ
jgi:hypothetical protein